MHSHTSLVRLFPYSACLVAFHPRDRPLHMSTRLVVSIYMSSVEMCTRRHPNTPFFTELQPELYSVATSEMDSAYHASGNGTVKVVQTQRAPPSWSPTACDTWNLAGLVSARIRPRIDRWHVDDQLFFGRRIDGVHVCPKVACRADSAAADTLHVRNELGWDIIQHFVSVWGYLISNPYEWLWNHALPHVARSLVPVQCLPSCVSSTRPAATYVDTSCC